ncbi:MAG: hypothetical protein HYU69_01280 [Bacteroidetes bacterium]|nr:hypothetical protein [Bacteroidota bacterium]
MKKAIKAGVAIMTAGIFLTACKQQIDESVIQSYTNENQILEQKVSEMKAFKYKTSSDIEKKQTEMVAAIDPKKKVAYEKDNGVKSELKSIKEKIDKATKEYEGNYSSLAKSIETNNTFIASIPKSEQDEEAIKTDWQQNMSVFNGIIEANNELQKQITSLSQQYNDLVKQIVKKYGKTETDKKAIKKK